MKLSIFEEVAPLPKSKQEKHEQSKKASQCRVITAANDDALAEAVCSYAWSPFIFHNNKRLADNFISTDFLVYDIDEGMTIDTAAEIVEKEKLCALILPSTSHSPENHRFRIILPLARTITSSEVYQETWLKGASIFGVVDQQTKDLGRFYFACRSDDGFWLEGSFFEPVRLPEKTPPADYSGESIMIAVTEDLSQLVEQIYGEKREKIPEAVEFFLKNAPSGIPGGWNSALNRAVFSLTMSEVSEEIIWQVCEEVAPNTLDGKDKYAIKRAIRDGKAAL